MRGSHFMLAPCIATALLSACATKETGKPTSDETQPDGAVAVWISVTHDQIRFDSRIDDPDAALFKILELNGVRVERGSPDWVIHLDDPAKVDSLLRDHVKGIRAAMYVVADNIANAETTNAGSDTETGKDGVQHVRFKPYRRKLMRFRSWDSTTEPQKGESPYDVIEAPGQFEAVNEPEHPHAVCSPGAADLGYLYKPNVSPMLETHCR